MSALENFLDRIPKGAEIAVHGEDLFFEGEVLDVDGIHILLSDGGGLYLILIEVIETFLFVPPDIDNAEIVAPSVEGMG